MTASDQIWHQVVVFLCVLIRKPDVLFLCVLLCVASNGDTYFDLNFFGLPASLHPIRSQIMDLVRFIVLNIEVVLLHSVLFPVQAKLPELLHICFTEHCSKIFKVKLFMKSTRATQLVLSLVLDYVHCSAEGSGQLLVL